MENSIALKDPVCGMAVTDKSFHQIEHLGHHFYFCGAKCKARFAADAPRYSGEPGGTASAAAPASALGGFTAQQGWWLVLATLTVLVLGGLWLV